MCKEPPCSALWGMDATPDRAPDGLVMVCLPQCAGESRNKPCLEGTGHGTTVGLLSGKNTWFAAGRDTKDS